LALGDDRERRDANSATNRPRLDAADSPVRRTRRSAVASNVAASPDQRATMHRKDQAATAA
jgi:hypothetical protein